MPIQSTSSVPIPRPTSAVHIHRPNHLQNSAESNTPLSHSPSTESSNDSPFPFSPVTSTNPASFVSNNTNLTTPPSSASLNSNPPTPYPGTHALSYPSVPPPSLSSSFGSPTVPYHLPHRDPAALSPVEALSRRGSHSHRRGNYERARMLDSRGYNQSQSHSRRESVERGARVAESGTLIPRSRAGSQSLASTTEDPSVIGG